MSEDARSLCAAALQYLDELKQARKLVPYRCPIGAGVTAQEWRQSREELPARRREAEQKLHSVAGTIGELAKLHGMSSDQLEVIASLSRIKEIRDVGRIKDVLVVLRDSWRGSASPAERSPDVAEQPMTRHRAADELDLKYAHVCKLVASGKLTLTQDGVQSYRLKLKPGRKRGHTSSIKSKATLRNKAFLKTLQ